MNFVIAVALLSLIQFFYFGALVAIARHRLDVPAPAMTGPAAFERLSRVQMNTLERLVLFLPLLWLAAQFWNPLWVAGVGVVFLVGRVVYWRAYVRQPEQRGVGNVLSMLPIGVLLLATLAGLFRTWV